MEFPNFLLMILGLYISLAMECPVNCRTASSIWVPSAFLIRKRETDRWAPCPVPSHDEIPLHPHTYTQPGDELSFRTPVLIQPASGTLNPVRNATEWIINISRYWYAIRTGGQKNGYWQESVTIRFRQSPRIDKKEIIPALQGTPDEQESVVEVAANRTQTANKQKSE